MIAKLCTIHPIQSIEIVNYFRYKKDKLGYVVEIIEISHVQIREVEE